jgi:hypothetical protein
MAYTLTYDNGLAPRRKFVMLLKGHGNPVMITRRNKWDLAG